MFLLFVNWYDARCYPELGSDLEKACRTSCVFVTVLTPDSMQVSIFRSGLQESTVPLQYSFSKFRNEWLYNFIQVFE